MQVTVRGVVNSDAIREGETVRVEWTKRVRAMHREGLITVEEWHPGEPAPQASPEPAEQPAEQPETEASEPDSGKSEPDTGKTEPDTHKTEPSAGEPVTEPPRSGRGFTAAAWRRFLDAQNPPVGYPEDATRDDLVALWDGGVR